MDKEVDRGPLGCCDGLGIVPSNCCYVYTGVVQGHG